MRLVLVLLSMIGLPNMVLAETVYVTDTLRIGVRPIPDNNAAPTSVVVSGMALEKLGSSSDYVKVRMPDGHEGWIKDIHITRDKPIRMQLDQISANYNKAKQDNETMFAELKTLREDKRVLSDSVAELKRVNTELTTELESQNQPNSRVWFWLGLIVVVMALAAASFYAGLRWHRQYVMHRLGGLRF